MTLSWADRTNNRDRKPKPKPTIGHVTPADGDTRYGAAALAAECQIVADAIEGTRNDTLNRAAFKLAQLVPGGHLVAAQVVDGLREAARRSGLDDDEIGRVLRSALPAGEGNARVVEAWTEPDAVVREASVTDLLTRRDTTTSADADTPEDQTVEGRGRTSWWPEPLTERAAQVAEAPKPSLLARLDGQPILYQGKVNAILGESESGKSWIALMAAAEVVAHGGRVLYLDFEDSPSTIHSRLTLLGARPDQVACVDYANPDEALTVFASGDLSEALQRDYRLVVVDGVNAAMTLLGLDLNSNTDATRFHTQLLRPLADAGPCVLTIDHVPKDSEKRGKGGIGAQAKRAMISGVALTAAVEKPFGKGVPGVIRLSVDKDRQGHVRGLAVGGSYLGRVHVTPSGDGIEMTIEPPSVGEDGQLQPPRPTGYMERVSRALEGVPGGLSKNQIRQVIGGRPTYVIDAINELEKGGFVKVSRRGQALVVESVKEFRE